MRITLRDLFILLVMAVLTGLPCARAQTLSPALDVLMQRARYWQQQRRWDLAEQNWRQVLLAAPRQPQALAGMAWCEASQGHGAQAEAVLRTLAQVDPGNPALDGVRAILRVGPGQQKLLRQATALAAAHHPRQAMARYRQVFGDHPPAGAWGLAYEETLAALPEGYAAAVAGLQDFARRYPGDAQYRLALGRLLTYRPATRLDGMRMLAAIRSPGDLAETARQAWRQALVWDQGKSDSLPLLKQYLSRYPDAGLQSMLDGTLRQQQANQQQQAQAAAIRAGYKALEAGQTDLAEQQFEGLRKQSPEAAAPLAGLGFVQLKRKDFAASINDFEAALRHPAGDSQVLRKALLTAQFWQAMSRGQSALAAGHLPGALDEYRQAMQLDPDRTEALPGVGGLLLQLHRPAEAVPVYRHWTQLAPDSMRAWKGLVLSLQQSGAAAEAMQTDQQMPAAVRHRLQADGDVLGALAAAAVSAGQPQQAAGLLEGQIQASRAQGRAVPLAVLLQLAALRRAQGETQPALQLYRTAVRTYPDQASAWEGLVAALHESGNDEEAMATVRSMPPQVASSAGRQSGYLSLLAAVQAGNGQRAEAEGTLRQAMAQPALDRKSARHLRLQLAQMWLQEGQNGAALSLFRQMAMADNGEMDAWKGWVMALHALGQDRQAITVTQRMPAAVYAGLETDPGYLSALAAAYARQGQAAVALELLRHAAWNDQMRQAPVPPAIEIQTAWLLMNSGHGADLYQLLSRLQSRADLNSRQQQTLQQIWVDWSLRQARQARQAHQSQRALAILQAAQRMWPGNADLRAGLAGLLLQQGQADQAYQLYLPVDSQPSRLADYSIAIGAALSVPDGHAQAARWTAEALRLWPQDPRILNLAAQGAEASGQHLKAVRYWREALLYLPAGATAAESPAQAASAVHGSLQSLASLLLNGPPAALANPGPPSRPSPEQPPLDDAVPGVPPGEDNASPLVSGDPAAAVRPISVSGDSWNGSGPAAGDIAAVPESDFDSPPAVRAAVLRTPAAGDSAQVSAPASSASPASRPQTDAAAPAASPVASQEEQLRAQIEQALAASQGSMSPYAEAAVRTTSRSGVAGIDQLVVQQSEWATSLNLSDQWRVTVAALPVVLDAGTPSQQDANGSLGTLPLNGHGRILVGSQGASGLGAAVRLRGPGFAASVGATPQGFPVPNWTGSLWITPSGSPISFGFDRSSVEDSLLSFAGLRDPGSGQIWGGVMANSFTLRGDWGTPLSGFYADMNLQTLHGLNVAGNLRTAVDFGGWRRVMDGPQGRLNLGLNFTTMHYQKNLDHFTFGEGGYFSPQRYFLTALPMEWHGRWKSQFGYMARASLGWQHFEEDASPMFPGAIQPALLQATYFPGQRQSGLNYDLQLRGEYHWNSNWSAGAYLSMNNTRDYASQSIGIYLRYFLQAQPSPHGTVPDLPMPMLP